MTTTWLSADARGNEALIEGDRLSHFGPAAPETRAASAGRLDCAGATIEPGRVNAHTHIYSGLAPLGMPAPEPPPEDFVQILQRVWWRLDRALDEPSLRAAARLYCGEALLAGTTTLIDHHESPALIDGSLDILAAAASELGIRALLCFGATERNGGRAEGRAGLAECRRFVQRNRSPLLRGAMGLHASFTVGDETVREAGELCDGLGVPLHVHLAEDRADVTDAGQRGHAGPLERLVELGALPEGSILAHGVHLDASQVRACAERRLWLVQNPRSNRGNNVGYPAALGQSDRVALGTDGYPARMDEEAEALQQEAEVHDDARWQQRLAGGWRLAEELFGARFAPLSAEVVADVNVCEPDGRTRHLVVGGRVVVRDGVLQTGDIEAIRAEARAEAARLWQRMAAL